MIADLAWILLHGGSHGSSGPVTFETALGSLVVFLVVVGALFYAGALEPSSGSGDDEPESGVGD